MKHLFMKLPKTICVILLLISSVILSFPVVSSTSYYVSTSGGDDNNTGAFSLPWRTIQKAADSVDAGDIVYVRGGTYYEEVSIQNKHGSENAWITFKPYYNEKVIVDGRNIPNRWNHAIFTTTNSSYLHITGFNIYNSARCGFKINALAEWMLIDYNKIINCSSNGIYTDTSASYSITNISFQHNIVNNVNNNWSGDGGSVNEGISFRNVQYFDISYNQISRCGKECIDAKHGSAYGEIHHNKIDTSSAPGGYNEDFNHIGIYIDAYNERSHDIDVFSNYVYGDHGSGIAVGAEQPTGSLDTIRVFNNIVDVSWVSAGGICIVNWGVITGEPISNVSLFSNTVTASNSYPLNIQADNLVENIRIENNIFATNIFTTMRVKNYYPTSILIINNNLFYRYTGTPHNEWNNITDVSWGEQAILADPLLETDFSLSRQSPAIDNGKEIPISYDYEGNQRPHGLGYDIGAFEYSTNNPPPLPPLNRNPVANASTGEPYQGLINTEIRFSGSRSSDPDGDIIEWSWDFGDMTNGTGKITRHIYSKEGTYTVTLRVTDNLGATNTTTTTCVIKQPNRPPTNPIISGPTKGTKNTMYSYSVISKDPDNNTLRYTFDWGDSIAQTSGFVPNYSKVTMNHSWVTTGRYNVTVTVSDNQNESLSTLMVYIDMLQIGDLGYLFDNNSDGIYDTFHNDTTSQNSIVGKKGSTYLIDSNGDGRWEYSFDVTNGLMLYQQVQNLDVHVFLFIGVFILGGLCCIIVTVILFKKKRIV
jgi:PKD repeat protein